MGSILAIESDTRQAALLKCVVRNHVGAALVVVPSTREAIAAIDADAPDLVLLSALLSPRDEEEAMAHLRGLQHADHLQTLTIPRFASTAAEDGRRGGLLGAFTRKRAARKTTGCDPKQFAEQIASYLQRAEDMKTERAALEEAAAALFARIGKPEPPVEERPVMPEAQRPVMPEAPAAAPAVAAIPAREERAPDRPAPPSLPSPAPLAAWALAASTGECATAADEDGHSVTGEIRTLLQALGLPLSLADLARAGGCRIHRVRVGSNVSSKPRALTLVTGAPRQSAPRMVRRVATSSCAAHA